MACDLPPLPQDEAIVLRGVKWQRDRTRLFGAASFAYSRSDSGAAPSTVAPTGVLGGRAAALSFAGAGRCIKAGEQRRRLLMKPRGLNGSDAFKKTRLFLGGINQNS